MMKEDEKNGMYEVPSKTDNELIAEFMGIERDKHSRLYDSQSKLTFDRCPNAPYDTSWDWLMPAYKRFRDALTEFNKSRPHHSACKGDLIELDLRCAIEQVDIKSTHVYLVQGIKWYNSQQHERK